MFWLVAWKALPAQDDDEVKHLSQIAFAALGDARLSDSAAAALRELIENGVKNLPKGREPEAEKNIKAFVDEMLRHSKQVASGPKYLDRDAFDDAKASICPLYPFC